jgi:outer membrane murein-binding lipoprotein Lpp
MNPIRKTLVGAGLTGAALLGGGLGAALLNGAATAQTTTTAPAQQGANDQNAPRPPADFDPAKGGHVGANGAREEPLTGDTAEKVKAAALAAVSGGTVQRVETDVEGSPYEAHMTKADGSRVTVKVDKDFKVTGVEDDGARGGGPGRR